MNHALSSHCFVSLYGKLFLITWCYDLDSRRAPCCSSVAPTSTAPWHNAS